MALKNRMKKRKRRRNRKRKPSSRTHSRSCTAANAACLPNTASGPPVVMISTSAKSGSARTTLIYLRPCTHLLRKVRHYLDKLSPSVPRKVAPKKSLSLVTRRRKFASLNSNVVVRRLSHRSSGWTPTGATLPKSPRSSPESSAVEPRPCRLNTVRST